MAGDKYLAIVAGVLTEVVATQTSAGAGDAGELIALDAAGKLDLTLFPTGIGPETTTAQASEALSDGDWVNIWSDSGTVKVRKADATTAGKECNGFVKAAFDSAATATIYTAGINDHLTGLTDGAVYFTSTTPGVAAATAPSASGNVWQRIGPAVSDTAIAMQTSPPITQA
jgi:hypothetical protein